MCEVIYLRGTTAGETVAPMRQPGSGSDPVSQCQRLGKLVAKVVERAEQHMNESAVTDCRGRR